MPVELQENPFDAYTIDCKSASDSNCASGSERTSDAGDRTASVDGTALHQCPEPVDSSLADVAQADLPVASHASQQQAESVDPVQAQSVPLASIGRQKSDVLSNVHSLADIDARLLDLALDHDWDDSCSLVGFGPLGDKCARSLRASVASAARSIMGSVGAVASVASDGSTACMTRTSAGEAPTAHSAAIDGAMRAQDSQSGFSVTEGTHVSSASISKRSKHDAIDYLRPMREQRELEQLCAANPLLCAHEWSPGCCSARHC